MGSFWGFTVLLASSAAFFPQLSLPTQTTAGPGASIVIPVMFDPQASAVSAVQFDLEYDSLALTLAVTPGDAARGSGKSVYSRDTSSNTRRFLIVGLNSNPIPAGPLVNLILNLTASASSGTLQLGFTNASSVDQIGTRPGTSTANGAITIQGTSGSRLQLGGVLNAASLSSGAIAPGEVITLMGSGIGPTPALSGSPTTALGVTAVSFDGTLAPLLYAGQNQINAIAPYEIAGHATTQLLVTNAGQVVAGLPVPVAVAAPAIFTLDGSGDGQGVIVNQDGTVNSPSNPARLGSIVTIYATGGGQTDPQSVDGAINPDVPPRPKLPVFVSIGGINSEILYAGGAPGLVSGVLQINCRVPLGAMPGESVGISLGVGTILGPPGATMAIQ